MNCLFWLFLLFFCGGNNNCCDCCERVTAEPAPVCPSAWNDSCPCDNRSSMKEDSRQDSRRDCREDSRQDSRRDCREDSRQDSRRDCKEDSKWQDSRMMPPPRNDFPGYGRGETCGCEENA